VFVALAVVVLADVPILEGSGFTELNSYFGFTWGDSPVPADVPNVRGQQTSADGQKIKLYGEFGPIDGARFRDGFVFYWHGYYQGTIRPGDSFNADLDFSVNVTGGNLAWKFYAELMSSSGYARILTDLMPMPPSGQVADLRLESSSFSRPGDGDLYESYLHVQWTDFSPTDSFTLTVPQGSVDITCVPEPGLALPAIVSCAFACVRSRSRRQSRLL